MSLAGLNLTAQYRQWMAWDPPVSNVTLTPDRLETIMAQVAAEFIWTGKRLYPTGLSQALPILRHTTQQRKLAKSMVDLTLAMGQPMLMNRLFLYALMSVGTTQDFLFDS
jgi:hypothetical protein